VARAWPTTEVAAVREAEDELVGLAGDRWLSRGQALAYGTLLPSIDRGAASPGRLEKLKKERQGIDLFRSVVRELGPGEKGARTDDIVALMVLRHHSVPTRLLDWTMSPHIAAFFAVAEHADADGELWTFQHDQYALMGAEQWRRWPETTIDGSGDPLKFDAKLTAFRADEPPDWVCCPFYPRGFPRQAAQRGLYSMTARFGIDHAEAISSLLVEPRSFRRLIIKASIKRGLRAALEEKHGITRRSLFPDSAGAAETVRREVFGP